MIKYILIFLTLNLQSQISDDIKHVWSCAALNFGSNVIGYEIGLSPKLSLTGSALLVFGIGAAKEANDRYFSWPDMFENTRGICMGTFGAIIYIDQRNKKFIDKNLYE